MKVWEIENAISEALSGDDAAWWNGADSRTRNEFVSFAQREGIEAALDQLRGIADVDDDPDIHAFYAFVRETSRVASQL